MPYAGQRQRHRGAARLRTFEGVEPMGRGRAKAKQVKVARQLKYNGGGTDLDRLRRELGVGTEARSADHDDPYADEYDADDEDSLTMKFMRCAIAHCMQELAAGALELVRAFDRGDARVDNDSCRDDYVPATNLALAIRRARANAPAIAVAR